MGLGGALIYRGLIGHCALYEKLGMNTNNRSADDPSAEPDEYFNRSIHVEHSELVNRSPEELYQFWRNFENLPQFMQHLRSVTVLDGKRSRWVAKGPLDADVVWEAEIINDEPGRLIAWKSIGDADVDNSGSVRFVPAADGTTVNVVIDYIPPAGQLGAAVARFLGKDPTQQVSEELAKFKELFDVRSDSTSQPTT